MKKWIVILILFTGFIPCLYSANFPIKRILEFYDNGEFEQLRKYLFQLKDYLLRDEMTIDLEHQLLYINILEAKAFYCMGKFDSVAMKIDEIEANTKRNVKRGGGKYQYLLYHDLHLKNINDCEHGQKCICNKYNFSGYESLDAWYEIDKYFANIWVVVKKKKDLEDKDYYRIPEPTVVKYNGEGDVMYLLRGPNQSKKSIPLAPVDDQEGIHEYDIKMAQYNRIQLINNSFIEKASKKIIMGDRLEFNKIYYENAEDSTYSLMIPYLPNKKNEWYRLFLIDEGKNTIYRNSFRLKRTQTSSQYNFKLFIKWDEEWTLHEAMDDNEIILEFPEEYFNNVDELVFRINGENIFTDVDSLNENGISFLGIENWEYEKWGLPPAKYVHIIDKNRETLETRRYKIDLSIYEGEDIEISFHDGYDDYEKELEAINKSRVFSIIAVSISILLILFFQ